MDMGAPLSIRKTNPGAAHIVVLSPDLSESARIEKILKRGGIPFSLSQNTDQTLNELASIDPAPLLIVDLKWLISCDQGTIGRIQKSGSAVMAIRSDDQDDADAELNFPFSYYCAVSADQVDLALPVVLKTSTRISKDALVSELDFVPISLVLLEDMGTVPCNLYLPLNKYKTVRIMRKDDAFGTTDKEKYLKKGVTELLIQARCVQTFLKQYLLGKGALRKLGTTDFFSESLSLIDSLEGKVTETAISEMRNLIDLARTSEETRFDFGLEMNLRSRKCLQKAVESLKTEDSPDWIGYAVANARIALETVRSQPDLKKLIESTLIDPESYIVSHSSLLAIVSQLVARKLSFESNVTGFCLALASLLHDVLLTDNSTAQIQSSVDLDFLRSRVPQDQILDIESHPARTAALIRSYPWIPLEVATLIELHHERPDGSGFPEKRKGESLPPLAILFQISHDLTHFILEYGLEASVENFFETHVSRYGRGLAKDYLETLHETFLAHRA